MPARSANVSDIGRNILAAVAYAGLTQEQLAEALNISPKTLQRRLQGDFSVGELERVREVTGAPEAFLLHGFNAFPRPDEMLRTFYLAGVDSGMEQVAREVRDLRAVMEERFPDGDESVAALTERGVDSDAAVAEAEDARAALARQSAVLDELVRLVSRLVPPQDAAAESAS